MTSTELIQTYESVLAVTGEMLEAARGEDWDRLVEREKRCRELIDTLIQARDEVALDSDTRRRKAEIIRKVLADDAAIRDLTQPWLARLQHLMTSAGRERQLHAAYGAGRPD
jgi:flagellar protein FliT